MPVRRQSIRAIRVQDETSQEPEQRAEATAQENSITAKPQNTITAMLFEDDSKATEKLTLYLHPSQLDKLDELIMEYKRRTRKRIKPNAIMRRLIDQATIDNLL